MPSLSDLTGPPPNVEAPAWVHDLVGMDDVEGVWLNEVGGVTYRCGTSQYLKWQPSGGPGFEEERARLAWVARYAPVPHVIETGMHESGPWMLLEALPGDSAVSDRWRSEPATAALAIGVGLRALHDAAPVTSCPFDWGVSERVLHAGLTAAEAEAAIGPPPPVDQLVVCHGDTCAPNTLLHPDGSFAAHVDLGRLGVADRWADIAVATYSLEWNYGDGYERILLDGYGVEEDVDRTRYYRALWDLT